MENIIQGFFTQRKKLWPTMFFLSLPHLHVRVEGKIVAHTEGIH